MKPMNYMFQLGGFYLRVRKASETGVWRASFLPGYDCKDSPLLALEGIEATPQGATRKLHDKLQETAHALEEVAVFLGEATGPEMIENDDLPF